MKPNIQRISELSGYSPATVSNVLNGKKNVNSDTVAKIVKIANEIGYVARNKQQQQKKIKLVVYKSIGTVVEDTPFFSQLFEGIVSECRENGYDCEIHQIDRSGEDYESYLYQILSDPADGILFLATELSDNEAGRLLDSKIPIVILDNWVNLPEFNTVSIDNTNGAYQATQYLIENGHTEIGYLKGRFRINNFNNREQGYADALSKNGIERNPDYDVILTSTMEGAYRDMRSFLEENTGKKLPTAFFADNDIIAFGAIKALKEKKYRIPEDISIVGFDDMPYCEVASPRLSTISVFKKEMGIIAVRKLLDCINGDLCVTTHTHISTKLIRRESVKLLES